MTWAVLLIRNFVVCKVHDSANPADDGGRTDGRTQQQKVFIKFLRLSSPRPPRPALPCPLSGWGGQCWGRFFVRCPTDRPFLYYLYATCRAARRNVACFEGISPNSHQIHPPSLPPVPRLSELHQNCHIRHAATVAAAPARSENPQVRGGP